MALRYDDLVLDLGYRLDLVVENAVVVELKSVHQLQPIHTAQLLSYLRAGDYRMGLWGVVFAPLALSSRS